MSSKPRNINTSKVAQSKFTKNGRPAQPKERARSLPGNCQTCSGLMNQYWCQPCESKTFMDNFKNWTSGSEAVDNFIHDIQMKAKTRFEVLEWIPYDRLNDLKPMAKGGFGSIYVATWIDGPRWTVKEGKLVRDGKTEVVIKVLDKLECGSVKFFEELKVCLQCSVSGSVLRCYGITRVPSFEKFAMVMAYCNDGDLHQTLRRSFSTITWAFCRKTLWQIAYGLEEVHKHNLVHGDFHSGNIFIVAEGAIIGDLGLCRLVDDVSSEKQHRSFGVLPYVAPENLRGKPYTHKSDVYSFGMIMWELTTGERPFQRRAHDVRLALDICNGLRPEITADTPDCYKELMTKCWDEDPDKRPTANEIASTLFEWHFEKKNHQEFNTAQALRLQMKRRNIEAELHSQAVYTSRLLDFPEVKAVRAKEETGDESDYKSRQLELAI